MIVLGILPAAHETHWSVAVGTARTDFPLGISAAVVAAVDRMAKAAAQTERVVDQLAEVVVRKVTAVGQMATPAAQKAKPFGRGAAVAAVGD